MCDRLLRCMWDVEREQDPDGRGECAKCCAHCKGQRALGAQLLFLYQHLNANTTTTTMHY